MIGFCGVDTFAPPFFFNLNQFTNDSNAFSIAVEEAIIAGFLKSGNILVMDNTAIHVFGENDVLINFLWEHFGIHVLMLPTHSPELNPIELLWNILVQHLKSINLHPS
jgi:transposase